jgi:sugar transferase (PEP-CTERM system associated)
MKLKLMILIGGDAVLALLAFYVGLAVRIGLADAWAEMVAGPFARLILFVFTLLLVSYVLENYNIAKHRSKREMVTNILFAGTVSFIFISTLVFLDPDLMIGRGVLVLSFVAFVLLQFFWHGIFIVGFDHPFLTEKIIVLGTGPLAGKIGDLVHGSRARFNHMLAGYVLCESEKGLISVSEDRIIGHADDLRDIAEREKVSKIIVALSERRGVFPLRDLLTCKLKGIEIVDSPAFFEQATDKLMVESMTPSWMIFATGFRRTAFFSVAKRVVDVSLSVIGIILVLPLFPFIALLVKLDSPGPVFFSQVRIGKREREFVLYKFRSMCQDAESKTGAVWAQEDDPRLRPIGRFLRKCRLDEIPQLYNVLKGDMSFVGPRPERPEFVAKLKEVIPFYSKRHFVKPGITGWAQVRFPYGASVDDAVEKLRYELYYIKNMSPILDTIIVLQTFKVVIFGRGGR